jgi:hypothetical protein
MAKKSNMPAVVHDHFRKANKLHTYVQEELGGATKHALEIGIHLLAAKKAVPHGSWEAECDRLFDGSLRTAQFYMQFTRDFGKIKTAEKSALLMLEGSLKGAAEADRRLVRPAKPKPKPATPPPEPDEPIDVESEPVDEDAGIAHCPNCSRNQPVDDDGDCAVCREPKIIETSSQPIHEPAGDEVTNEPEAADSAGTRLKDALEEVIADWRECHPDAPSCLVGGILESLAVTWESELGD